MARNENLPFERGTTLNDVDTTISTIVDGEHLEGKEYVVEDYSPATGIARTGRPVRLRIVRNTSGINLLPKRLVKFEAGALEATSRVDGYAITSAANTPDQAFPVDEYLPAAGVPNNHLFYIVVEGPAEVQTSTADMAADLAIGGWTVAVTAASSQNATTAGRIIPQLLTGATAPLAHNIQHRIGRALSAALTNATSTDVVIDVKN